MPRIYKRTWRLTERNCAAKAASARAKQQQPRPQRAANQAKASLAQAGVLPALRKSGDGLRLLVAHI